VASDAALLEQAVAALPSLVAPRGPYRELRLERIDRGPVGESTIAAALTGIGFRSGYRGYVLRSS